MVVLLQALQRAAGRRHLADADLQRTTEVSLTALLDNCGFHHPVSFNCNSTVLTKCSLSGFVRALCAAHVVCMHVLVCDDTGNALGFQQALCASASMSVIVCNSSVHWQGLA